MISRLASVVYFRKTCHCFDFCPELILDDLFDYDYDMDTIEDFVLLTTTSVIDIYESEKALAEKEMVEETCDPDPLQLIISPELGLAKDFEKMLFVDEKRSLVSIYLRLVDDGCVLWMLSIVRFRVPLLH